MYWPELVSVLAYSCSAIGITVYNKWLLWSHGFHFPILMIMVHMFTNSILAGLTNWARRTIACCDDFQPSWIGWKAFFVYCVPVGIFFGFDIAATNYAFSKISVSMTEVIKSGTGIVVMLVSFWRGKERPTKRKGLAIIIVGVGMALTSFSEADLNTPGLIGAIIAMVCASLRVILQGILLTEFSSSNVKTEMLQSQALIKRSNAFALSSDEDESDEDEMMAGAMEVAREQGRGKLDPIESLFYFAPVACVSLIPAFFTLEYYPAQTDEMLDSENIGYSLQLLMYGAGLAFSLNVTELFVIHYVGVVSFIVASAAKFVITLTLTSMIFGHPLSAMNKFGLFITCVGIILFSYIRYHEKLGEGRDSLSATKYAAVWTEADTPRLTNRFRSSEMELGVLQKRRISDE